MPDAPDMHERLLALARHPDWDELQDVCDEIEKRPDGRGFVPDLLKIVEANQDFDFGSPGPIVRTVETFDGFEHDLVASIRRAPTFWTIWMVNRLANAREGAEREMYIALLQHMATNESLSSYLHDRARDYLDWQVG